MPRSVGLLRELDERLTRPRFLSRCPSTECRGSVSLTEVDTCKFFASSNRERLVRAASPSPDIAQRFRALLLGVRVLEGLGSGADFFGARSRVPREF
jgi:hypothetical protein